jgi:hypothetical protein
LLKMLFSVTSITYRKKWEFFMASKDKKQGEKRDDSTKSELIKRFKANPFLFTGTILVLVIVVIAFVFVPAIVPEARGGGDLVFGYYNRVPIKYAPNNYFFRVQQILTRMDQPSQDDPDIGLTMIRIWRRAFEETVIHMGILDEMKQAGFVVPEAVVNMEMAMLPQFQENGRFSSARYRAMDNNTRMNLWREVQENHTVEIYLADINNLRASSAEIGFVAAMASPQRSFDLAVFPLRSYPDSEVISFAEANPDLFRLVRFSSITVTSEREGRQLLDSVRNGVMTFEEAAQNNSVDWAADRGGDRGSYMAFELPWEIRNDEAQESLLSLGTGELTNLFRIPAGWAFYRVDEAASRTNINDPINIHRARNYITQHLRGMVEDWAISEAERFSALALEIGFDAAIAAEGLTKRSFGPVSLNYGSSALFGSIAGTGLPELAHAGNDPFFWRAAFQTPLNSISRPVVVGDNVMVLLPLEETDMDESEKGFIMSFHPHWIRNNTGNVNRSYFLDNVKLDDRFYETFQSLWR